MTNGTTTIDYEYNADGIRTKKTVTTASNHTHVFQDTVIAPTCTENGYTLHSCVCGYIYQDSPVAAIGHTFTTTVVGTNCTEVGHTVYSCACGYYYEDGSNGHDFTTLVVEPSETVNGFTLHQCDCGYSYESDPVVSLASSSSSADVVFNTKIYDYIYNGSSLTQLTITTNTYTIGTTVETLYFGNGTVTYNGEIFYHVTNLQGDVIAILNDQGTAVVEYTYDAWGNILTTTGSMANTLGVANPLTYRGYVYDTETSLYYLQSRYYDPEVGRFINADAFISAGGFLGYNMFACCHNNPIMYIDPTGTLTRGQIHDMVLERIMGDEKQNGRTTLNMRKNCIYYNRQNSKNGWGFCDLYDSSTGEVWELKRITCNEDKAKNQIANYVRGRLKNELDLKLTTGGRIIPDGEIRSFVYQDDSGTYTISYWDGGNGILWYDYEYERSKKQAETDAAIAIGTTTVACVAIAAVVLCSGGTAVAAAPAVIPFVVHAANAWSNAA